MLKLEKVTGGYANIPVLKDVTFEVADGELVGLIGLNGAGKSTTINEIIGLLTPYGGQIAIDGLTIQQDPASYRQKIGYIPETPSLYEELTLREHLETVLMAYGLDVTEGMARADKYLKLFRLDEKLDWFPTQFSKGMKQKVMIICAFIVNPSLFIVDEPFLGLDPLAISDLIELLAEEKANGKSILMSTHVLDSAEKMCDRFVILHHGQILAQGTIDELRQTFGDSSASLNDIYMQLTEGMARADKYLKLFRLDEKLDWFPTQFSKGMKQKVMIICAFIVNPSLFIVDEPFLGLDPLAISDLIELLAEEKANGKSILMSTHVLDSAEKMCDRFVILHHGQILAQGTIDELRQTFGDSSASLNDIYMQLTKGELS